MRAEIDEAAVGVTAHYDGFAFATNTIPVYAYLRLGSVLDTYANRIVLPLQLVAFFPERDRCGWRLVFLSVRPSGYCQTRDSICGWQASRIER